MTFLIDNIDHGNDNSNQSNFPSSYFEEILLSIL